MEDGARAMREQPKRFSRNYPRRIGGNIILYVLVSFHTKEVLYTLSCFLYDWAFVCFSDCLAVHYFAIYSVLRRLIKQTLTPTATASITVAVQAFVIILCSFLWRSLQKFTNQQCRIGTFYIFERT